MGSDELVQFRGCETDNLAQLWFVTRAYPSDGFDKSSERTRNAMLPSHCLTRIDDPDGEEDGIISLQLCTHDADNCPTRYVPDPDNDDEKTLLKCRADPAQLWEPKSGRTRLKYQDQCLSVKAGKLYVVNCHGNSRQKFKMDDVKRVSNFHIANFEDDFPNITLPEDHRFKDYTFCKDNDQEGCFLNVGDIQKYGYHFGTDKFLGIRLGSGTQNNDGLLDLGDRYSVDRCTQAHDKHYWMREGTDRWPGENERNLLRCLDRIIPTTAQENTAVELAEIFFNGFSLGDGPEGSGQAPKACGNLPVGELPVAGVPIESCWCREEKPYFNAYLELAEQLAAQEPSEALRVAFEGALDKVTSYKSKIMSNRFKCSGATKSDFGVRVSALETQYAMLEDDLAMAPRLEPSDQVIGRGDILWRLAQALSIKDIPAYVAQFATLNPGTNPNLLFVGKTYTLPAEFGPYNPVE